RRLLLDDRRVGPRHPVGPARNRAGDRSLLAALDRRESCAPARSRQPGPDLPRPVLRVAGLRTPAERSRPGARQAFVSAPSSPKHRALLIGGLASRLGPSALLGGQAEAQLVEAADHLPEVGADQAGDGAQIVA